MPGPRTAGVVAVTMGEPAGIGAEIALKAWASRQAAVPPFALLGDPEHAAALSTRLGLGVPVQAIGAPEEAAGVFPDAHVHSHGGGGCILHIKRSVYLGIGRWPPTRC